MKKSNAHRHALVRVITRLSLQGPRQVHTRLVLQVANCRCRALKPDLLQRLLDPQFPDFKQSTATIGQQTPCSSDPSAPPGAQGPLRTPGSTVRRGFLQKITSGVVLASHGPRMSVGTTQTIAPFPPGPPTTTASGLSLLPVPAALWLPSLSPVPSLIASPRSAFTFPFPSSSFHNTILQSNLCLRATLRRLSTPSTSDLGHQATLFSTPFLRVQTSPAAFPPSFCLPNTAPAKAILF